MPEVFSANDRLRLERGTKRDGDCLVWTGYTMPNGYGSMRFQGRTRLVHRVAWVIAYGEWPSELDHTCNVRNCVNVEHLRELNHRANVLRGTAPTAINARKTHCPRGHEYVGDNFRVAPTGGRICRVCDRERKRRAS